MGKIWNLTEPKTLTNTFFFERFEVHFRDGWNFSKAVTLPGTEYSTEISVRTRLRILNLVTKSPSVTA